MSENSTSAPATHLEDRIQTLENAVYDIDALAQSGLRQITSIAKLALTAMESPSASRHPETIAQALHAIWGIAEQTDGCINSTAESSGCPYKDDAANRRLVAHYSA